MLEGWILRYYLLSRANGDFTLSDESLCLSNFFQNLIQSVQPRLPLTQSWMCRVAPLERLNLRNEAIIDQRCCSSCHLSLLVHFSYELHIFCLAMNIDTGHWAEAIYRTSVLEVIPHIHIGCPAHICLIRERVAHLVRINVVVLPL